jgi:hypothetical protein
MTRRTLSTLIALVLLSGAAYAQPPIDPALLDAARKAMPADLSTNVIAKTLDVGLWSSNRTAIAISINRVPKASVIFVFLKQRNGWTRRL